MCGSLAHADPSSVLPLRLATLGGEVVLHCAHGERVLTADAFQTGMLARAVHVVCEHGVCGACTVRLDGSAVRSCLTLAIQADGRAVDSAEGLGVAEDELNDLQRAFRRYHGLQCGYCTTGISMSASDYLDREPRPTEDGVRDMLSGHLCRCTDYVGMVKVILDVADERAQKANADGIPDPAQG